MVLGKPQTDPTLEWFLSHCHIHKYPSKSTLIHQGEKAETLYYIVKGSVAVLIKDEEGKEMILSYLNQGDFIGELGLFEEGQERSAWVRAKTACEVAEISYKKFRQLIQVNPDILMRLSAQMARRLQVTSEKVGNLAFLDVTGRIAQTLLNLAKQPDALHLLAGVRVAHALFRTGSAQTVLLHPGQMIPASASGLRQYAFRYSRGWRTAYGDADPAYRREGHSLPGPAGRPVWPPWKWPFFSGRALLQNPPPAQWVTGRRVQVNSAGE